MWRMIDNESDCIFEFRKSLLKFLQERGMWIEKEVCESRKRNY